jgi:DNA-binding GntR family transcriptional regulator
VADACFLFGFDQFEQLYDLRMILETTAVQRLCAQGDAPFEALQALAAIWLVPAAERSTEGAQTAR